jgi:hypothetical protein
MGPLVNGNNRATGDRLLGDIAVTAIGFPAGTLNFAAVFSMASSGQTA